MYTISYSVGIDGSNHYKDVLTIQKAINASAKSLEITSLKEDGSLGSNPVNSKTATAIKQFQTNAVSMSQPDGRVDANGKTLLYLNKLAKPTALQAGFSGYFGANTLVTYSPSIEVDRQIVSEYTKDVIKLALERSGMQQAVITSTIRSAEKQAQIMYQNLHKSASYDAQFSYLKRLYGNAGDQIYDVLNEHRYKPKTEAIALAVAKIKEMQGKSIIVSKHCVSQSSYAARNVVDIGFGSTRQVNKVFDKDKLSKTFEQLHKEGYIAKYILESRLSCWHLEIIPHVKPLSSEYNQLPTLMFDAAQNS